MTEERINMLESRLARVISALIRKDTDQDGDWGWQSFREELKEIRREIGRAKPEGDEQ